MSANKKSKSVLKRQKPRKRKPTPGSAQRWWLLGGGLLVASSLLFVISSLVPAVWEDWRWSWGQARRAEALVRPWQVQVQLAGELALSEENMKNLQRVAQQFLQAGQSEDLEKTVASIVKLGAFGHVAIKVTGEDSAVVLLSERRPVMTLKAWGEDFFVGADGEVYLHSGLSTVPPRYSVIAEGLLGETPQKVEKDKSLKLDQGASARVLIVLNLVEALREGGLEPSRIWFEEFRGYHVTLAGRNLEISLGMPPFPTKLERLAKILENFREEQDQISQIELDYQGKAFIRKRS